jgi:hypothetical protein
MRVSVLLPSRGRPESLGRSIEYLRHTATHPEEIEVLVGYDADDPNTATVAEASGVAPVQFPKRFGYSQLHRYVNDLAERAAGEWLLLWNDDALMLTLGWDSVIAHYEHTTPRVLSSSSTGYGHSLCCFPTASRGLYEALGHLSLSPHVDTWLQDLGRATGILTDIPVQVHHDRYDLTGGHNDQTRAESLAGYRTEDFYGEVMQSLLAADIRKVQA